MTAPTEPSPAIAGELHDRVRLATVRAEPVSVADSGDALRTEIARVCAEAGRRYHDRRPAEIAELAPARELYRSFGIDPTRLRPSSESLLRRVLRGLPFPEVQNAVDVGNLCSLLFLLPLGLYDAERIQGSVRMRRGHSGEHYAGIRKDAVHLEGRPVLSDAAGPFGNPTSDSLRTSVTHDTRSLWMVIFAPSSFPESALTAHAACAARLMALHIGAAGVEPSTSVRLLP